MFKTLINIFHILRFLLKNIRVSHFSLGEEEALLVNIKSTSFIFTKQGDLFIKSPRAIALNAEYIFDNCEPEFIEDTIRYGVKEECLEP